MDINRKVCKKLVNVALQSLSIPQLKKFISRKSGLVVMMYHSTPSSETGYAYANHRKAFTEQIDFINEYFEVMPSSLIKRILQGEAPHFSSKKPRAIITFDDGYLNNYDVARPVLEDMRLPYTIFLTTNLITQDNTTFMSWGHIQQLAKSEFSVLGAHCQNHFNLRALEFADKYREIVGAKETLEDQTGCPVDAFAYPGGAYDAQCLGIVSDNFAVAFKDRCGRHNEDLRKIGRLSIDARHNNFKDFLVHLASVRYLLGPGQSPTR